MRNVSLSSDDELLGRLQAPPDLHDGLESLTYWRQRRRRLPLYRLGARREAARMVLVWERRVRAALFSQRGVALTPRLHAAALVARVQLRRRMRRVAFVLAGVTAIVLMFGPVLVVMALALRAL